MYRLNSLSPTSTTALRQFASGHVGRTPSSASFVIAIGLLALPARTRCLGLRVHKLVAVWILFTAKHFVLRWRHGLVAFAITPQDCI